MINNLLPKNKRKNLDGTVSLCHCRDHNCIRLGFYFDGFYETETRLYSGYHFQIFKEWEAVYVKRMYLTLRLLITFPMDLVFII